MTVCKFWQQGNCKFGDRCRFEHPNNNNNNNNRGRSQTNRFGALGGGRGNSDLLDKYKIDLDIIEKDLTSEVPQWILSCYAPGRDAPQQLFGGYPREQSFEEMRLHFLESKAAGNEQVALNQAQELYQDAQNQMQNAVRNLNDAVQFIVSAEDQHPNRHDTCREGTQGVPFGEFSVDKRGGVGGGGGGFGANTQTSNPFSSGSSSSGPSAFGGGATAQGSAFGQPSAMGAKPNPFASTSSSTPSAFGQPSQPQPSAFGQPAQPTGSAFGQAAQTQGSAFGQPSAMGAKPNPFASNTSTTSPFGQSAQPSQGSAFGQPSQPSAFGQPSQAQGSAFGQPSTQGSAFGQASQNQGSAFGQPSQMGAKPNPFASGSSSTSSPFASAGNTTGTQGPSPFAQKPASPFGGASNNASPSPFGQPAQQKPNPFAASSQPTSSTAANPFAAATNQNNAFAQAAQSGGDAMQDASSGGNQAQQTSSPFASAGQTGGAFSQQKPNPFASPAPTPQNNTTVENTTNPYPPESTKQHPSGYMSRDGFGNLSIFKGQQVSVKDGKVGANVGGRFIRIWFPEGPPGYNKDTTLPVEMYDEETLRRWKAFEATGQFEGGVIPELPPPREATVWDF